MGVSNTQSPVHKLSFGNRRYPVTVSAPLTYKESKLFQLSKFIPVRYLSVHGVLATISRHHRLPHVRPITCPVSQTVGKLVYRLRRYDHELPIRDQALFRFHVISIVT